MAPDKQVVKIGLEREKVESAKMEAQAGMLKAANEASNIAGEFPILCYCHPLPAKYVLSWATMSFLLKSTT
jgi:hypothetical protein